MNDIEFRPARREDFAPVSRLVTSREELFLVFPAGSWPFSVRQVHALAQQREDLTVAERDGQIIGFANLYDRQPGESIFIGNLLVRRDCRGHGIGKKLVGYMLDRIYRLHSLPVARISVFSNNVAALSLYRGLGFKAYASEIRSNPGGAPVTLLHMHKAAPAA